MATNIPPHNLGELVDVLSVLIHNPEATVSMIFCFLLNFMQKTLELLILKPITISVSFSCLCAIDNYYL